MTIHYRHVAYYVATEVELLALLHLLRDCEAFELAA